MQASSHSSSYYFSEPNSSELWDYDFIDEAHKAQRKDSLIFQDFEELIQEICPPVGSHLNFEPIVYPVEVPREQQDNSTMESEQTLTESVKYRHGSTQQAKTQKMLKIVTGSHICKNLPSELLRKIRKFLSQKQILTQFFAAERKRLNISELVDFIHTSNFSHQDWNQVLDMNQIQKIVDKSKKLGTSKNYQKISTHRKTFLIQLNKKMQKIMYRSVKRVISQILNGNNFISYLDQEAHHQFLILDQQYLNCQKYSSQYISLLEELQLVSN